jgi:Coenzyme PQQ synthesis protein D (PqqD)
MSEIKPLARQSEVVTQEMGDEILIYDLKSDKAFALNTTSSIVWQYCDGKTSVSEIARKMSEKLSENVSEDLVWLTLDKLHQQKLLQKDTDFVTPFEGISRRKVIQRIGFASMIALPVIGNLVAPFAAQAQSVGCPTTGNARPLNCPCTAITQCQPPSTRCCLSSPGAPGNQTCVVTSTQINDGGLCGNSCSCISNCCAGGLCVASMTVTSGNPCSVGCQCVTGTCTGGTMCA